MYGLHAGPKTEVLARDPCPLGLPELMTAAHVEIPPERFQRCEFGGLSEASR